MFNRQILFEKQDGTIWEKLCNEKDLDNWCYLFKTYGWKIIKISIK